MDNYVDTLKSIFVEVAKLAKVIPKNVLKPKKYWCPDLSQARDTKRFWWRLWTDNGRSREGEVYKCYKNVKNLFRKLLRQCVTSKNKELYESLYRLLKRVLKVSVKRTKKSKLYTNIEPSEFS